MLLNNYCSDTKAQLWIVPILSCPLEDGCIFMVFSLVLLVIHDTVYLGSLQNDVLKMSCGTMVRWAGKKPRICV